MGVQEALWLRMWLMVLPPSTLLKAMRGRNPELKIIFVSGYAEDAFEKSLPENEQFAFLAKPFTQMKLAAAIRRRLAESRQ